MRKNSNKTSQPTQTVTQERPAHIDSGEASRSGPTERENQTASQNEPDSPTAMAGDNVETLARIAKLKPIGGRKSLLASVAREEQQIAGEMVSHQREARQTLAEAKDLFSQGEEQRSKAQETAAKAGILLYQDRAQGRMSNEELNGLLGDIFGFRGKGDDKDKVLPAGHPNAGKTPAGEGEAIRKRVVRFVQADGFVNGGETSKFFDGMDKAKVSQVLNNLANDKLPFWQAYVTLSDMKREGSTGRINPAFDAKAIAKIVAALATSEAPQKWAENPALVKSYSALLNIIRVVDEQAAEIAEAA